MEIYMIHLIVQIEQLSMYGQQNNNMGKEENISDYNLLLGLLQVYDLFLNLNQVSNDTILKALQNQDKIYLEKIIEQNNEIIKLLKKK